MCAVVTWAWLRTMALKFKYTGFIHEIFLLLKISLHNDEI